MNWFQKAGPSYRSLWGATGWWGPAWAVWTALGFLGQAILMLTRPADEELRRNVNMVFAVVLLVLLFQMMSRIRDWQDANAPKKEPETAAEPTDAPTGTP